MFVNNTSLVGSPDEARAEHIIHRYTSPHHLAYGYSMNAGRDHFHITNRTRSASTGEQMCVHRKTTRLCKTLVWDVTCLYQTSPWTQLHKESTSRQILGETQARAQRMVNLIRLARLCRSAKPRLRYGYRQWLPGSWTTHELVTLLFAG